MTNEQRREEIKRKFNEAYNAEIVRLAEFDLGTDSLMDFIFDFFYSEIENRDEQIEYHAGLSLKNANAVRELQTKLQRLEEIIKAADEVMSKASWSQGDSYYEAKEHYNNLKKKQ